MTQEERKQFNKEHERKIREKNRKLRKLAQELSAEEYWKLKDRV